MVVSNPPSTDVNEARLVRAWRPPGSQTVLWAQDMETGQPLHLVQWGDGLYLPVINGLRLGIGVYNGASNMTAYPTYIEAKNLYDEGPSQPNDCTPSDMWEVPANETFMMDALKNRDHQTGRPLIIVPNGQGMGIGEATFGATEYRGLVRVYERTAHAVYTDYWQSSNSYRDCGGFRGGGLESTDFGYTTRGDSGLRGGPEIGTDYQVGIGAGAEERRPSYETGVQYNTDSRLVVALRVESRQDLAEVLRVARRGLPTWHWPPNDPWWFTTWPPSTTPVSPHIPIAHPGPHQPEGTN